MRILFSTTTFLLFVWSVFMPVWAGVFVTSPDGKLSLFVSIMPGDQADFGCPMFSLRHIAGGDSVTLLDRGTLGLKTDAADYVSVGLLDEGAPTRLEADYRMKTGKRIHCRNEATAQTFTFENDLQQLLRVEFRVYNDGVAFRYRLPAAAGETILTDHTAYHIADGTRRWIQNYQPDSYEGFYPLASSGEDLRSRNPHRWAYPALIQPADSLFLLLTESDIACGHCASRLNNQENSDVYRVEFADACQNVEGTEWISSWRVLIAGDLATLVQSTLVTDVAAPAPVDDASWIHPGSASWIYWAYNHGSRDFLKVKEYIDLAAAMHWPYSLIDAEWDEMTNGGSVEDAISYAASQRVEVMLWYNSSTNWVSGGAPGPFYRLNKPEDREREFAWLEKMGVKGVKIDFFKGDDACTMDFCRALLQSAARHHLLVTFHGATIPRGWQRTYPNLMTTEGVYGAEWYNNNGTMTHQAAAHNATLPFTRNIVGSMDYTPGTFTDSQYPHITTHGHELALPVVFESALLHHPDRPVTYLNFPTPVRDLLSTLPTVWDDTRFLGGYPGEYVMIARRKGAIWYIGALNGTDAPLTFSFNPAALNDASGSLTLFTDGADGRSFEVTDVAAPRERITIRSLPRGGFVGILR